MAQGQLPEDKTFLAGVAGALGATLLLRSVFSGGDMKVKPATIDLAAGTIDRAKIKVCHFLAHAACISWTTSLAPNALSPCACAPGRV